MVGLDSLYAMLARPVRPTIKRKRLIVEETDSSTGIAEDAHEAPQSKLPQSLERRQSQQDRRENEYRGDRRGASEKEQQDENKRKLAENEAVNSPLPRIDIDI
ncbi:hypothetical protein FM038_001750 [Shewanella eurypsychrophilus]|uniref:Uncharacterized protein n=1 Tax=Shewanella eurypsychrophilus TaxID=2593656 RepID=A0ABX6V123_9GAMM|nr:MULTISPECIES: hypothetical protein [Shewanella]QFU20721.1 hypothetical protein FS418_01730 [Shewanella sp. YLB-09]QFU20999.1 hypothetical protein FS418_03340 [Shewanella sp. YLB-09]QPG56288.1 hypothetical protein FM038_001750 [Shewanella eurypsychrophilus]